MRIAVEGVDVEYLWCCVRSRLQEKDNGLIINGFLALALR